MARPPALTTEIGYINPSATDPASWIPGSVPSSGDATSHSCSIDTPDGAIPNESTNRATRAFFMSQRDALTRHAFGRYSSLQGGPFVGRLERNCA